MTSPSKLSALRFFEQMEEQNPTPLPGPGSPTRSPLAPSFRFNSVSKSPKKDEDLDALAKQLEIAPVAIPSPSKTAALRSRFEQPSATVSSFKSASQTSIEGSPRKKVESRVAATESTPKGPEKSSPKSPLKSPQKSPQKDTQKSPEPKSPRKTDPFADQQPEWANKNYKDILASSPRRTKAPAAEDMPSSSSTGVTTTTQSPPPRPQWSTPARPRGMSQLSPLKAPLASSQLQVKPPQSPPASPTRRTSKQSLPQRNLGDGSPAYEYLCRIQALKNWLEHVLQEEIAQSAAELINYIRNGIYLAKLANLVLPQKRSVFTNDSKLQFRHTENINRFFQLLDYMNVPDLFRFELTDLYDAKNVPKVWFCLHALTYMLNKMNSGFLKAENLVGALEFSPEDIRTAARALVGSPLPNFASADSDDEEEEEEWPTMPEPIPERSRVLSSIPQPSAEPSVIYVEREPEVVYVERPPPQVVYLESPQKVMVSSAVQTSEVRGRLTQCDVSTSTPVSPPRQELSPAQLSPVEPSPAASPRQAKPKKRVSKITELTPQVIMLQALARGANFRYRMFVNKIMLKSYSDEITDLQSVLRGAMSRSRTVHRHRQALTPFTPSIIGLQSVARRRLVRQQVASPMLDQATPQVTELQAILRGHMVRKRVSSVQYHLFRSCDVITELQSISRQRQVAEKYRVFISNSHWLFPMFVKFQSQARGKMVRAKPVHNLSKQAVADVTELQSVIRGEAMRYWVGRVKSRVYRHSGAIGELQAIARGGISRTRMCNNVLVGLLYEDRILNQLYAKARGNKVRREVASTKRQLAKVETSSVLCVQSLFRGLLVRSRRDFMLEDIYENIDGIIELQARARGAIVRRRFVEMDQYYQNNLDSVIKAQSIIKTWATKRAFDQLLSMKNPPLLVIRRFAYLLADDQGDYAEEMDLSATRDRIVDLSKHNESLDSQIESLDIKLQMLDKNKITLDEFSSHKVKHRPLAITTKSSALSKSARAQLEFFQTVLYLLQTQPQYLKRVYSELAARAGGDMARAKQDAHVSELFNCVTGLFPIKEAKVSVHSREEYFFIKLISGLMADDIKQHCPNITDITRVAQCWWIDYFIHLNCHTYQRQHLKQLMGMNVAEIVDGDHLDFESDPGRIYADLRAHELKIHGHSDKQEGVNAATAIKCNDVSQRFVNNLMQLRESATAWIGALDPVVDLVPLHVRVICKQVFTLSQLQFPDRHTHHHLAVAGVVFAKHYLVHILTNPENFGYLVPDPFNPKKTTQSVRAQSNLHQLSRVVIQLFSLKPFSDNFLKPLNDYLATTHDSIRGLISRLIDVGEMEDAYDMNDYDDIITTDRPSLTIGVTSMISFDKVCREYLEVMAPSADDQLYQVIAHQRPNLGSADDYVALTGIGMVTLELTPATREDSWADAKAASLFTMVKRSLLYIIRVQGGDNLLELLVSAIGNADESKFREVIANDAKSAYSKTSLGNINTLTYHELKKKTLENLLKLENMGVISRQDSFQAVLNQIAIDIKTKDSQRQQRRMQLAIATKTVMQLTNKEHDLSRQLAEYNSHVNQILTQLQKSPKDRKILKIIPVLNKQYFYHRELRKRNRLPKFGSYKYSAKKLMDQGILIDYGNLSGKAMGLSKVDFMFSCHLVGKFTIEAATGSVTIPGASQVVTLDELLSHQYEHESKLEVFGGMATFDSDNFMAMICRKFYDIKQD